MIKVNAMGDNCPLPVIKTKKAMLKLKEPDTIEVLVDNEIAVQNVTKLGTGSGGNVTSEKLGDKQYKILIQMAATAVTEEPEECRAHTSGGFIVVISSDRMGSGNDELGKVLMKGFIFALSQTDVLPQQILFYNGGATLTSEESDSLEDLKNMEAQGVEILTCGTCLDYYGLKEKLKVGQITNMYSIVETMQAAGKIIKP